MTWISLEFARTLYDDSDPVHDFGLYRYDPATNTWDSTLASMNVARRYFHAGVIGEYYLNVLLKDGPEMADAASGWGGDLFSLFRHGDSRLLLWESHWDTPADGSRFLADYRRFLEREFRVTGGHWHHGELALDQFLMMRPAPKSAQYRMPVDGLWLCGAGTHPGGGVMGCAGRNAARAVLGA